jgi:transcriptional regulator with XRE-family HTH domain
MPARAPRFHGTLRIIDMDRFGVVLKRLLDARGLTVSAWARNMGIAQGFASNVLSGRRTPPLEALDKWAEALRLTGFDRVRFIDLAVVAHLPVQSQTRFLAILDEQSRLQVEVQQLSQGGNHPVARAAAARKPNCPRRPRQ